MTISVIMQITIAAMSGIVIGLLIAVAVFGQLTINELETKRLGKVK